MLHSLRPAFRNGFLRHFESRRCFQHHGHRLIAVSASQGWEVKALDLKQAYLKAPRADEFWLERLRGEVVKACKAMYKLRQSAMESWKELRRRIGDARWKTSEYDECLYYCCGSDGEISILTTYVNNILLNEDDGEEIQINVKYLMGRHEEQDLEETDELVGVNLEVTEQSIALGQSI